MNNNYENLRENIENINSKLNDVKNTEKSLQDLKIWQEKINDVWSPSQMKEAKDEVYKQKNRWTATIAILLFVQIVIGIIVSLKVFF